MHIFVSHFFHTYLCKSFFSYFGHNSFNSSTFILMNLYIYDMHIHIILTLSLSLLFLSSIEVTPDLTWLPSCMICLLLCYQHLYFVSTPIYNIVILGYTFSFLYPLFFASERKQKALQVKLCATSSSSYIRLLRLFKLLLLGIFFIRLYLPMVY